MNKAVYVCLCLFIFVFVWAAPSNAIDWITANQVTLSWDPVTTLENGDPIPDGNVIKYEIFHVPENGSKTLDYKLLGETLDPNYVLTFADEGNFILGVRASRWINNILRGTSVINWTDDPSVMKDGAAQGIMFFRLPGETNNLEILQNGR